MSDAPNGPDHTASQTSEPGPTARAPRQGGGLLALVRKLVDYGRDLVASLQHRNAPTPPPDVALSFGTLSLTLIIARITRGLRLAAALEARLVRRTPLAELPERPRRDRAEKPSVQRVRPAQARAARPKVDEAAELPDNLPSAEEIAARIRGRRAGMVLAEICRDLGIDTRHPLWREIRSAIIIFGGKLSIMLHAWCHGMANDEPDPRLTAMLPPLPAWYTAEFQTHPP